MRTLLLAGTTLLALAASVATAAATPIFSDTMPGATSTTLMPGTYDIVATGAGGGGASSGSLGGLGFVVEGTFTFATSETLSILVGGKGGSGIFGTGGGGGAASWSRWTIRPC